MKDLIVRPMTEAEQLTSMNCVCTVFYKCKKCGASCSGKCFQRHLFTDKLCKDCHPTGIIEVEYPTVKLERIQ